MVIQFPFVSVWSKDENMAQLKPIKFNKYQLEDFQEK